MKRAIFRNVAIGLLGFIAVLYVNSGVEASGKSTNRVNAVNNIPLLAAAIEAANPSSESRPEPGFRAPSFSTNGDDGTVYKVDGVRDKAVLLNFWASWCDPCKAEAPELNRIAEKFGDRLEIYGINVTSYDNIANAQRFADKYKLSFPVMYDIKGDIFEKYNGAVFPTNVLVGRDGVVAEVILGGITAEQLEDKLKQLDR
ncbi:TlpA family protein disulfide reductase [Paenibacillus sp. HN-1]|uniref:TlpA family protein disulfide reductase n=1 Tax=Paenibacillus TaxID=44249 RepID=UPI001CA98C54|nr:MULTISPECIES: TlpA disulfide reductase family protein [Paenibacillus]MBY9082470.1 TlpA family protein disulfide reductase [Paenibacillus sp. CGMCC 1.18879]MBY9084829.1 TlpA family protein disulfide reductase [Paenibacillus sinensis]